MPQHEPTPQRPATEPLLQPLHEQEDSQQQSSRNLALHAERKGAEGHASLSASIHEVFGNTMMQAALSGLEDGPGQIVQGLMSLGAAGVVMGDHIDGVMSNSMVQGWLAGGEAAGSEAMGGGLAVAAKRAPGDPADGRWGKSAVRSVNTALSRAGRGLPGELSGKMGAALGGVDFSSVRIHTDAAADRAAAAINARAFTVGSDVYFSRGAYNPSSREGQELLAHELTHVRQHIEGRLPGSSGEGDIDVSSPSDPHEVEAERAASEAVSSGILDAPAAGTAAGDVGAVDGGAVGVAGDVGVMGIDGVGAVGVGAAGAVGIGEAGAVGIGAVGAAGAMGVGASSGAVRAASPMSTGAILRVLDPENAERVAPVIDLTKSISLEEVIQMMEAAGLTPETISTFRESKTKEWRYEHDPIENVSKLIVTMEGDEIYTEVWNHSSEGTGSETITGPEGPQSDTEGTSSSDDNAKQDQSNDNTVQPETATTDPAYGNDDPTRLPESAQSSLFDLFRTAAESGEAAEEILAAARGLATQQLGRLMQIIRGQGDDQGPLGGLMDQLMADDLDAMLGGGIDMASNIELVQELAQLAPLLEEDPIAAWEQITALSFAFQKANLSEALGARLAKIRDFGSQFTGTRGEEIPTRVSRHASGPAPRDAAAARPTSSGQPLPVAAQRALTPLLGSEVGRVRLHDGADAAAFADALNAEAATVGQDIYLGSGARDVSTPGGMELLAEEVHHAVIGGGGLGTSQPGDAHERAAAEFARGAAALVAGNAPAQAIERIAGGIEAPGIIDRLQHVFGAAGDPAASESRALERAAARAARTDQLVTRLTSGLRLSSDAVSVRTDSDAAAQTRAHHTRGLMTGGGEILLDEARFDPETTSGRALLAHEVAHVAQESMPAMDAPDPGGMAEADAHVFATRFASGGGVGEVSAGLPAGHVAAEGDVSGAGIAQLVAQHKALNEERAGGLSIPEGSEHGEVDENSTENRQKKVSQYEDGVDGVADLIGDQDAFEELRDAIFWGNDRQLPLNNIRASSDYDMLCQMWQGALDGGQDSASMQGVFNNEFSGRGFWGNTEEAYDLVEAAAKRDARRSAEADAAAGELTEENVENAEEVEEVEEEGTDTGTGPDTAVPLSEAEAQIQALMDAAVEAEAPVIPAFEQLKGVSDGQVDAIIAENNHLQGIGTATAGGTGSDRAGQIWDQLTEGFTGAFTKSFVDQFNDTLILDTVGMLGDKALTLATRGAFRTPFIGPMIGVIQSQPWSGQFWSGLGDKGGQGLDSLGSMVSNFGRLTEAESFSDGVGIFCAALADMFSGLRDILDVAQQLIGTLSAVCYVAGGILIGIGLALLWLAGVGAPLITAGGWLVRVGGILARINTALGAVVLVLSGLATLFRTAAAFFVPAEMYAEQLVAVGDEANAFGEKAGAKAGDVAATSIKDTVAAGIERRSQAGNDQTNSGEPDGQAAGDRIRDANEAASRDLDETRREVDAEADQRRQQQEEDSGNRPRDDDAADGNNTRRPMWRRALSTALSPITGTVGFAKNAIVELGSSLREGTRIFDPRQFHALAAEGLQPMRSEWMREVNERQQQAAAQVQRLQGQVGDLQARLAEARSNNASHADVQDAAIALSRMRTELSGAQRDLQTAQERVSSVSGFIDQTMGDPNQSNAFGAWMARRQGEELDQARQDEANADPSARRRLQEQEEETERQRRALEEEEPRLREQVDDLDSRIRAAEAEEARAQQDRDNAQRDLDQENAHLRGIAEAEASAARARDLSDQQRALRDEARQLRDQAESAEIAARNRSRADQLDAEAQTAQNNATRSRREIEAYQDKRVYVELPGGGTSRRRVVAVHDDGLEVTNGRGNTMRVPFADISAPQKLHRSAAAFQEQSARLQELEAQITPLREEANRLNPDGTDANTIREQAASREAQADGLTGQIDAARNSSSYDHIGAVDAATHQRFAQMHERNRDSAAARLGSSADQLTRMRGEQETARERLAAIPGERTRLAGELETLQRNQRQGQGMQHYQNYIVNSTSGNATGGVGSAYKDVLEQPLFNLFLAIDSAITETDRFAAQPQQQRPTSFGQWAAQGADEWLGTARRSKEQVLAVGARQAALEQLSERTPPVDVDAMLQARDDARLAAERYVEKHDWAYQCFTAEEAVETMSQETLQMARAGDPLQKISAGMAGPLQQSRSDEEQRQAALGGGNTNVPEADSQMGGLIAQLVVKLSDHADDFDDQPSAGSESSGEDIAGSQNQASEEATAQSEASSSASQEQRDALDQAITVRTSQEESLVCSIQTLESKHEEEQAIKSEIQRLKAQALAERDQARAETERHAQQFNDSYAQLSTWSEEYRAAREAIPE